MTAFGRLGLPLIGVLHFIRDRVTLGHHRVWIFCRALSVSTAAVFTVHTRRALIGLADPIDAESSVVALIHGARRRAAPTSAGEPTITQVAFVLNAVAVIVESVTLLFRDIWSATCRPLSPFASPHPLTTSARTGLDEPLICRPITVIIEAITGLFLRGELADTRPPHLLSARLIALLTAPDVRTAHLTISIDTLAPFVDLTVAIIIESVTGLLKLGGGITAGPRALYTALISDPTCGSAGPREPLIYLPITVVIKVIARLFGGLRRVTLTPRASLTLSDPISTSRGASLREVLIRRSIAVIIQTIADLIRDLSPDLVEKDI